MAGASSRRGKDLTVRSAEDGGEEVAQRVATAQVRLGSGEAALRRLRSQLARRRFGSSGEGEKTMERGGRRSLPRSPLYRRAW